MCPWPVQSVSSPTQTHLSRFLSDGFKVLTLILLILLKIQVLLTAPGYSGTFPKL